jgi:hypothetical protein
MEVFRRPIPIEVTYGADVGKKKLQGMNEFMKKHGSPFGILVTRETFDLREEVVYIPLWFFLLMC